MGLGIFLPSWDEFAAKTELEIGLEYFCRVGVGLRNFCPKRREKKNWT